VYCSIISGPMELKEQSEKPVVRVESTVTCSVGVSGSSNSNSSSSSSSSSSAAIADEIRAPSARETELMSNIFSLTTNSRNTTWASVSSGDILVAFDSYKSISRVFVDPTCTRIAIVRFEDTNKDKNYVAEVWDLGSHSLLSMLGFFYGSCSGEFNSAGNQLATVDMYNRKLIRIWDVFTGTVLAAPCLGSSERVCAMKYASDNSLLIACDGLGTIVFNVNGARMRTFNLDSSDVGIDAKFNISLSSYSCLLTCAGDNGLTIWDFSTGIRQNVILFQEPVKSFTSRAFFGPCDEIVVHYGSKLSNIARDDGRILVTCWDLGTGTILYQFDQKGTAIAFNPRNSTLLISQRHSLQIVVVDASNGCKLASGHCPSQSLLFIQAPSVIML
jgi:WD40 repeat protein